MSRRDEIRARLDAATPGPWEARAHHERAGGIPVTNHSVYGDDGMCVVADARDGGQSDADLIAHAPADLRDLLAVAEAAREVGPPECEDCYEDSCTGNGLYCPCDERCHNEQTSARMALRNALVRLDAVTGGER